jgi:transposase
MQPRRGRSQKRELVVSEAQRTELERLAQQSRRSRSIAFRALIVLECGRGLNNAAVAAKLRTTGFTVGFWRNRFIAEGVAGLDDEPRPGAPRQIGDDKIEQVVRLTLERTPKGATHWSSRGLAARSGLSQSTISRIWRAFGLKTHRTEKRDIVGLYMNPPEGALVLCVDEKSQSNPSFKPQPADSSLAPRATGASYPRLSTARRNLAVRRTRHCHGQCHRQVLSTASLARVPGLPKGNRQGGSGRLGPALGSG